VEQEDEHVSIPVNLSVDSTGAPEGCALHPILESSQSGGEGLPARESASGCALSAQEPPLQGSGLILDEGGANTGALVGKPGSVSVSPVPDQSARLREKSKNHYRKQRLMEYTMLDWMRQRLMVVWLTLTSSRVSDRKRLRQNYKNLRDRLCVQHEWERDSIKYRCVDTTEGLGVLHIVQCLPIAPKSVWFDYRAIGEWWEQLHGARQIKWVEVGQGMADARKLSCYLLAQYTAGQNQAVRFSASRGLPNFKPLEKALHAAVFGHPDVMPEITTKLAAFEGDPAAQLMVNRLYNKGLYKEVRQGMAALLLTGMVMVRDTQYVMLNYRLEGV
jgi:hypothetical protein